MDKYQFLLALCSIITGGVVATTFIATIGRYFTRRRETAASHALNDGGVARLDDRLQRMEQGIEAMAVEIERISEGQRFTTRLLSERTAGSERVAGRPNA